MFVDPEVQLAAEAAIEMISKWHEAEPRFQDAIQTIREYIGELGDALTAALIEADNASSQVAAELTDPAEVIPLLTDAHHRLLNQDTGKPVTLVIADSDGDVWDVNNIFKDKAPVADETAPDA